MPSFPDLSTPLTGAVVQLRPAAERDIPEILIAHQDDPDLHVRLGLDRPPSGAQLGQRMERQPAERAAGASTWLTIIAGGSDECQGQLDVHGVDWDHRRAELGIWVAPGQRGRGLAADALRIAGRWLIRTCGLERLALLTEPGNTALRRAAAAAGYREEGMLRSYLRERGRGIDTVVISLVGADLPPS